MNKKTVQFITHSKKSMRRAVHLPAAVPALILVGLFVVGGVGMVQQVHAAQSMSDYCSKYSSNDDNNACKDGVKGLDCGAYQIIFAQDPTTANKTTGICNQAAKDRAAGIVSNSLLTPTPTPTATPSTAPSTNPNPTPTVSATATPSATPTATPTATPSATPAPTDTSSGASPVNFQNFLEQAKSLSQYIDILHNNGPDANVDTTKGVSNSPSSYVNGAGKQQPIKILQQGTGNSPIILFFNGGGWHNNDLDGERIQSAEDNGENPWNRGYAMLDVTYRLGSSGIYYMYEDVMRAIQHVHDNAALYGADPNKMVIWGDSAGGSLVMRAAASGKTGAKAAVGWSAPTNAFTVLFRSFGSLAIGIDHSTCAPTDLAGLANFADLLGGGSGDVAQYGQGLSSNDFSAIGYSGDAVNVAGFNPLALLTEGFVAGKNLLGAAKNFESITNQIGSKDFSGLAGSTLNLASKKFVECIDNFNVMSPALFASPDTPPSFLAEFENDGLIGPDQAYGMRDKLRQLGIKSEAWVLPGSDDCMQKAIAPLGLGCHLGYYSPFIRPTLDFLDSVINTGDLPAGGGTSATGGGSTNSNGSGSDSGGGSSGNSSNSGSGGGSNNSGSGGSSSNQDSATTVAQQKADCESAGKTWVTITKNIGYCPRPTLQEKSNGYYTASYVKSGDSGHYNCPKGGTFTQDPQKGNICKL